MIKNIRIVSLSKGIIGESYVKHEVGIGVRRLEEFGLNASFSKHALMGKEYIETACEMPMYKLSSAYKGPVLIIHGTGDELVPYSYGEKYKHVYENATMYPLAGVNHNFVGNEDEVAEKTADFIKENTEF